MAGRGMDEFSRVVGRLENAVSNLVKGQDEDRDLANKRHSENSNKLESINKRCGALEETVRPLASTVQAMKPIVDSVIVTKWKLAGALSLAGVFIWGVGWALWVVIDKFGGWLLSHMKLG